MARFVQCLAVFVVAVIVANNAMPSGICTIESCPAGTVITTKQTKTSSDFTKLIVNITCKNSSKVVLKQCDTEEDNSYGPDVQINTFQYRGSYSFDSGDAAKHGITDGNIEDNININVTGGNKEPKSEVETLD